MALTLLEKINESQKKKDLPHFGVGDQVVVSIKIKEGEKERLQNFEGIVIDYQCPTSISANVTVRKIASGAGVERTFPLHSPHVEKIKVKKPGKVHRAKLYYLRGLSAKNARIRKDDAQELKNKQDSAEAKVQSAARSSEKSPPK